MRSRYVGNFGFRVDSFGLLPYLVGFRAWVSKDKSTSKVLDCSFDSLMAHSH